MTEDLSPQGRPRGKTWLLAAALIICLVCAASSATVGCGSDNGPTETTGATAPQTTALSGPETTGTATATGQVGGTELADAIVSTWADAIRQLNTLLESHPDPAGVQSQVEALKEQTIQKLVEQGRTMAAMSESDRTSVRDKVAAQLASYADETWYLAYVANWEAYSYASGDVEFVNLLSSFNTLTEYSDFELLKDQDPQEAARLGVD